MGAFFGPVDAFTAAEPGALDLRTNFGINILGIDRLDRAEGLDDYSIEWYPDVDTRVQAGDLGLIIRVPQNDGSTASSVSDEVLEKFMRQERFEEKMKDMEEKMMKDKGEQKLGTAFCARVKKGDKLIAKQAEGYTFSRVFAEATGFTAGENQVVAEIPNGESVVVSRMRGHCFEVELREVWIKQEWRADLRLKGNLGWVGAKNLKKLRRITGSVASVDECSATGNVASVD